MILKVMETGPLQVNTYIVGDSESGLAAVIDPGGDADEILEQLNKNKLKCQLIINTHTHFDHSGGNARLKKLTGAPLLTHPDEAEPLQHLSGLGLMMGIRVEDSPMPDQFAREGDVIKLGSIEMKVIELPGHSPCAIGLLFDKYAIVGDALFAGSIGRTDFPGGNFDILTENIRKKLFILPDDTVVLPGHGPATTIGREKKINPFF